MHVRSRHTLLRVIAALLVAIAARPPAALAAAAAAQAQVPAVGILEGVVSTQNGAITLGAVLITLTDEAGEVASATSDTEGKYRFDHVIPGRYSLVVAVEGFSPLNQPVIVEAGQTTQAALDLQLAPMSDHVEVVAPSGNTIPSTGTLTPTEELSGRELEELSSSGGFQSALRLLISVIEVPGGVSIKGGRPSQSTVQLGPGAFVDPATGLNAVSLPDDAIDSVTVLPNPYAVEYGRFSSGLVLIKTRRAADQWKTRLNNLDPSFRTKRGTALQIIGISAFSPRFETGGPLIKHKLYLQQAFQYRYRANDVESRPQSELKTSQRLSSYTRADAALSPNHSLVIAAGLFPTHTAYATLGTFTPPPASVDMGGGVNTASVTARSLLTNTLFSELTGEVHSYETDVKPQGTAPMELLPETTLGNFYNTQNRKTSTFQLVETVSGTHNGEFGLHLYKAGIDLLHSRYQGSSASRSVLVRRTDGVLVRRFDYRTTPTLQSVNSTDLALFAQDRLQPNNRWYLEFGARVDRDGVIDRFSVTPRVGAALLLDRSGNSVLRGGYGLFYERTPSAAGAFTSFETPLDTRFAADGATPASQLFFRRIADDELRTARSLTWDLAFDHRFNAQWATRVSMIDRHGSHELLVQPRIDSSGAALVLDSSGQSRYREAEIALHYTSGRAVDLNVSYVRAQARADLNAFTTFFDSVMWPVVGQNQYAAARSDVPNRLLARARAMPRPTWLFVGVLDWRTGLPYSVVNESLDFVGPRNSRRFPTYVRVDLGVEHRVKILKLRPWIGVRADNAFDAWLPSDVQANNSSPAFGSFYNTEYRQFRIQVRFER